MHRNDAEHLGLKNSLNDACHLTDFIFWLSVVKNQHGRDLLRPILKWLATVLEYGDWIWKLSGDALDIPVNRGPGKKVREMASSFKEKVVREASQGDGVTSGRHALSLMHRYKLKNSLCAFSSAHKWVHPSMRRYLTTIQTAMRGGEVLRHGVISLAWDATRLSNLEMLFSTMFAHGKACWCPPMVPSCFAVCTNAILTLCWCYYEHTKWRFHMCILHAKCLLAGKVLVVFPREYDKC